MEKENIKCEHNWQVIISISYMPWEEFMKYRGDLENAPITTQILSHTIFCVNCKEIKKIT